MTSFTPAPLAHGASRPTAGVLGSSPAHERRIRASVGTALWRGEPTDLQDLLGRADAMLYRAKEGGRGRHCLEA